MDSSRILSKVAVRALVPALVLASSLAAADPVDAPWVPDETDARALETGLPQPPASAVASVPSPLLPDAEAAMARMASALALEEYVIASVPGGWSAPNRQQDLRATWAGGFFKLTPRVNEAAWRFAWETASVGRLGQSTAALSPIGPVLASQNTLARGRWIQLDRGSLREWYLNDARGFEQVFEIDVRPEGAGELVIEGRISGLSPLVSDDAQRLEFVDGDGEVRLIASELIVRDAHGQLVAARFDAPSPGAVRLIVEDADAAYPLQVDPLFTTPVATFEPNQAGAQLGIAVASAGDVNGDSWEDILVGANLWDGGQTDEGAAFIFVGGPFGLSMTPSWRVESNQVAAQLGSAVAAGDFNGDGRSDIVVGARLYDNGQSDEGAVFVFLGGPPTAADPSGLGPFGTPVNADWRAESNQSKAYFGTAVAAGGDVNADNRADLVVGAPAYTAAVGITLQPVGGAFLWTGGASGAGNPTGLGAFGTPQNAKWRALGTQNGMQLGAALAFGDTNGDRRSDVVVGAPLWDSGVANIGAVHVYRAPLPSASAAPDWTATSGEYNAQLGFSVATADINADGYADVVSGAPYGTGRRTPLAREGWVGIWNGGPPAIGNTTGLGPTGTRANADWTAESDQANSRFGWSVSSGRGISYCTDRSSVIIGAPLYDAGARVDRGLVATWDGLAGGIGMGPDGFLTAALGGGNQASYRLGDDPNDHFGNSVAGTGDLNSDKVADAIVGAWFAETGPTVNEGHAYVFVGTEVDIDFDQIPDACDNCIDIDGDGFGDPGFVQNVCLTDNCPGVSNPTQADTDFDGIGDACDPCTDTDGDGWGDPGFPNPGCGTDNCPTIFNNQFESEFLNFQASDGLGDPCDNCPLDFNPLQENCDGDPQGDACDADDDNDGAPDVVDPSRCDPTTCGDSDTDTCDDCAAGGTANPGNDGPDCDGDGICDAGDPDDDNDGQPDGQDYAICAPTQCADTDFDGCDDCSSGTFDPLLDGPDCDGDGICDVGDGDDDNDGVSDFTDTALCNPNVCADTDFDGCDDCSQGFFSPALDGPDCDGDGLCDSGDGDDDNDGAPDALDSDDCNPFVCKDSDGDTCDDCSSGANNIFNDGPDCDGDGRCDDGDSDDDNDGRPDLVDSQPCNPFVCANTDLDGPLCDDCVSGYFNPANDGLDCDLDGKCNAGSDHDDADGVPDDDDLSDCNRYACRDLDFDTCDDCSSGVEDPANDGPDCDGDGFCDAGDSDKDGDGLDDATVDPDDDNDGIPDASDAVFCDGGTYCADADGDGCDDCAGGTPLFPGNPADDGPDCDGDGICDAGDVDDDNDGVPDAAELANMTNPCGAGACGDSDGDGCDDCTVVTPGNPFNDGPDCDGDGICDASPAETDDDNDGVLDVDDNVPSAAAARCNRFLCRDDDLDTCNDCASGVYNPANDGPDFDRDGLCDAGDPDDDNDGVPDVGSPADQFPFDPRRCYDSDGDGCDDCSGGAGPQPASDGPDCDGDGLCDAGDADDDNDGVADGSDNAPCNPRNCRDADSDFCDDCANNPASGASPRPWAVCPPSTCSPSNDGVDTDGDGRCDGGDADDDNDGVPDSSDAAPLNPRVCRDADGDGCDDCSQNPTSNATPNSPAWPVCAVCTASNDGLDTDGDGLCDAGDPDDDNDNVTDPFDPNDFNPRVCGDADGDGCDDCSQNPTSTASATPWPNCTVCGVNNDGSDCDADGRCDLTDPDDDNDLAPDSLDSNDCNPFVCNDTDNDGCDDCTGGTDNPNNDGLDTDGDGLCDVGDPDRDNDGAANAFDNCPTNPLCCNDSDGDGCDDCSVAAYDNPLNDGPDCDNDGICNTGDLDDDNDGRLDGPDTDDCNRFVCGDLVTGVGLACDDCRCGYLDTTLLCASPCP